MSEPKINAEIIAAFQEKFNKLNASLAEHIPTPQEKMDRFDPSFVKRPPMPKDDWNKVLAEIRKVIEELNKTPEPEREYIALHLLQPFVVSIMIDRIYDQNAQLEFFKAVFGDLDLSIMKKVLFEMGPSGIILFGRMLHDRSEDFSPLFRFLTERYPDWVNVRVKNDNSRFIYIYNKKTDDPPVSGEHFLIFHYLRNVEFYYITDILIEHGANLLVKEPSKYLRDLTWVWDAALLLKEGEKSLTPLDFFDIISVGRTWELYNHLRSEAEKENFLKEMRARIVAAMEEQQAQTRETLSAIPAGPEQAGSIPKGISDIISQYADHTKVPKHQQEMERLEWERMNEAHEAHLQVLREEEARVKAEAERAAGQKPKQGPSGGLEDVDVPEPKEKPKPQGHQGLEGPQGSQGPQAPGSKRRKTR